MVWFILLNLLSNSAFAQNWCNAPERPAQAGTGGFSLRSKSGCAPFTAEIVSVPAAISSDKYIYDYRGGDPFSDSLSRRQTDNRKFVFSKPGKYRILQLASGGGMATGTVFCDEVEVLESRPVSFTVVTCADQRVTLTIASDSVSASYDEIRIDWGDGTSTTVQRGNLTRLSKIYANSSQQTITVQGIHRNGGCQGQARTWSVTPGAALNRPVIQQLTDNGSTLTLSVRAEAGEALTLLRQGADGAFAPTSQTLTGPGTFTVSGVSAHPTCFKVATQDACGTRLESDEACSIGLEATAEDKQNVLRWTSLSRVSGFVSYQIQRNGTGLSTVNSSSTLSLTDAQGIQCGQSYCYRVVARTGQTDVQSAERCVTGRSGDVPTGFARAQVSVTAPGEVALQAFQGTPPLSAFTMVVTRSNSPTGPFTPLAEIQNSGVYLDGNADTQRQTYCYQVAMKTGCGVTSAPTTPVCTIHLDPEPPRTVEWTPGSPFLGESVTAYTLEAIDPGGQVITETPLTPGTRHEPDLNDPALRQAQYRIKAVGRDGSVSYSNLRTFQARSRLFVPDAFSPNGDGINDRFEVKGETLPGTIRLIIYNRWGEVLFSAEDQEGWDGTARGQPAPSGLYTYRIELNEQGGPPTVKRGTVLLIR